MKSSKMTSESPSEEAGGAAGGALRAGIYVHWPFCARKCPYCDFYTFGREHPDFDLSRVYLDALLLEIGAVGERFALEGRPRADTVYFGGGTPSLMAPDQVGAVMEALGERFRIEAGAEITLEVNPTAAEAERLGPMRRVGVNRLSVGCQSFNDEFLEVLGRDHDAATARRTLAIIREMGYANVSQDLMFGLPGQKFEAMAEDLEASLAFGPEHVSVYALTLHEGTPFKRWHEQGRWRLPGSDVEARMFEHLIDRLDEAGYVHYEISNWARPGYASRHNQKYWRRCTVFAFGASAHGVVGGRRYANPRDLKRYVERGGDFWKDENTWEDPPPPQRAAAGEAMMLALRRIEGVGWEELDAWIGRDARHYYRREFEELEEGGLIVTADATVKLTRRGLLLADRVMERFF